MRAETKRKRERKGDKKSGPSKLLINKIHPGEYIPLQELVTIRGVPIRIPSKKQLVHLQFRRFAGCPVCNLHLQTYVRRYRDIVSAGIQEVVIFHSSVDDLLVYADKLPFAVVADPNKLLYTKFGVESSPKALLNPRAWWPILRAVLHSVGEIIQKQSVVPPVNPDGGSFGLPADFLIDKDGWLIDCKYGEHADDQWSVNELLHIVQESVAPDYSNWSRANSSLKIT